MIDRRVGSLTTRREFLGRSAAVVAGSALVGTVEHAFAAEKPRPKTILLKSAWETVNIGDIGHTPGTLRILEQHLPDVHVILWAAVIDERVEAMLRRRFPKIEIVRGRPAAEGAKPSAIDEALARADLAIHNSSMSTDLTFMAWCRRNNKPYGLYGQSYFPEFITGPRGKEAIDLLNSAAFVYCRDGETLKLLKGANIRSPVLEFAPDGCFGIDVRDDQRAAALMKGAGLEDRKFITIQLRTNTAKRPGIDDTRTPKLNPLHPTPEQIADDERRAAVYRELISAWIEKTGNKVLIAPEVEKEMAHNKRLLFDPLPKSLQSSVVNCETFWNADEAASVFARCHTAVCHEPHSLIIALANGRPILHTFSAFHSPKCWMFRDIGLAEWLLEFDSTPASKMAETLWMIDADYSAALAKVERAMEFVRRRQADTMQVVGKLLG